MGDEAAALMFLQATEPPVDAVIRVLTGPSAVRGTAYASLGLGGLPSRIGRLAGGMIYRLACEEQALRLPILAGALAATLESGKQCALITPADPGILLRKARLAGFALEPPLKEGRLAVFQLDPTKLRCCFWPALTRQELWRRAKKATFSLRSKSGRFSLG